MSIGVNGFGRIGKCVFLQLIENAQTYTLLLLMHQISIYKN